MLNDVQLNSILEDFDVAYWNINLLTKEISWSPHFHTLVGKSELPEVNCDHFVNEILHKDFRYDFRENFQKLVSENEPFSQELRIKLENGKFRWFECRTLKNREGSNVDSSVLLFVNIHQAKRDQYTIEENFFYYRETAEMTSTGGWYHDAETGAVYWDEVTKKILNCPHDYEPVPGDKMKFYAPEHQEFAEEIFKKCLEYGIPFKVEIKMLTFHNSEFWIKATGKPVYNKNQDIIGIRGVFQDIDIQKTNEINLQNSLDIIAAQNSRLFNFAHIVSHNLRSHSSNLSLISQLLSESKSAQDKLDLLTNINHIAGNLEEAIHRLNEVVTKQTNLKMEKKTLKFQDALEVVIASTSSLIKRENAQIIPDFQKLNEITYSSEYLESILLNLITNAIKYCQKGRKPVIYIQTYEQNGSHFLEVSDNGMGIDLEQYGDKMFGMYKTFHRHPEANGIGLFITKNQVEAMGGSISVTSTVNIGTTFKIKF
ncbi:PAS domain-containing sensor histidine kinase [Salinimicrobium sp. GXAS 041]|uniref:PAS domain-containing sensor histidine kinase n=1 Tax=Salinimicrobium sp. GXAS 041 TaxID=3400806 RepID=UPI003C734902